MASKVYFADFRCPSWRENLPQKLARLMMTAGFGDIDMDGKYVAIKMHFGEHGAGSAYRGPGDSRKNTGLPHDLPAASWYPDGRCCSGGR